MMYKDKIKQLCQEQTNLDEADIEHLVQQADELLKNSAYANEDVFIDVKNIFSEHAIVIFHKKPESKLSLYENSVVGAMAYLERCYPDLGDGRSLDWAFGQIAGGLSHPPDGLSDSERRARHRNADYRKKCSSDFTGPLFFR